MNTLHSAILKTRPAFLASLMKRLLRIRRRVVSTELSDFFIDPVSLFGAALLSCDGYEPHMVNCLKHLLRRGDVFLDLGANEGFFSILAANLVGPTGRVVSIEPQSRLQQILFRNIKENSATNISVFQRAIADSSGVAS